MKNKMDKFIKSFQKVFRSLNLLKLLILLQVLFGRYFSISNSKLMRLLTKLYCVFLCSLTLCKCYSYSSLFSLPPFYMMEYLGYNSMSLIFSDEYFSKFYNSLKTNDRIMGFKIISDVPGIFFVFILLNAILKIFINVIGYLDIITDLGFICYMSLLVMSIDLSHIFLSLIFDMIRRRMHYLRYFLERNHIPINIVGENEIAVSVKNVRKSLYYYNNLLDLVALIDKHLQYMLVCKFLGNFPKLLFLVYTILLITFKLPLHTPLFFLAMAQAIVAVFVLSFSAIIVEITILEVNKIQEIFTTQLVRCSDESLRFELQTALQYVRLRPFRYTLCRAVPLNINMLFCIVSLCITYVIVALQLTHFTADV